MEVTFAKMIKQVPVRIAELIVKLISVKGVILGVTIWLTLSGLFDPWVTFGVFLVVIFGREALKIVQQLK